ncbi:MAG: precorrin-2 C(20)-methyltransferase [Acidimicrobiales bacterium]
MSQQTTPQARSTLVGIGVGPGNPEFVTLAALRTLDAADLIFGPTSSAGQPGRAETIIRSLRPELVVTPILFEMSQGSLGIEQRRQSTLGAAEEVVAALKPGFTAAFLTLGDPNIFSTFNLLAEMVTTLAPNVSIASIPGIMAFQAVVATTGMTLLNESERLSLLTGLEVTDRLDQELGDPSCAIVIYKGGRNLGAITRRIEAHGRSRGAVIGIGAGLPGGTVSELTELQETETVPYLSTIIIPPLRHG